MYSVMNHQQANTKPSTQQNHFSPSLNYQHNVKPQSQSMHTGISPYSQQHSKLSMKQLYKNQLDQFMGEKQKQRQMEKEVLEREKQEYRQRVRVGQENQKMKDLAYKNYYKMLMDSHQRNSQSYVSPYQLRDRLKDSHIQKSIHEQMQRSQNFQYEKRMRQLEKKNAYKEQLAQQIQERKSLQQARKNYLSQENSYYKQHSKNPQQIQAYHKQKKKEQMQLYKHDLDRLMQDKHAHSRKLHQLNMTSDSRLKLLEDLHNPLVNPLPYNIQNPYILKQMQKLSSQHARNESSLYGQQKVERPRNQSSYFARQANNVLM